MRNRLSRTGRSGALVAQMSNAPALPPTMGQGACRPMLRDLPIGHLNILFQRFRQPGLIRRGQVQTDLARFLAARRRLFHAGVQIQEKLLLPCQDLRPSLGTMPGSTSEGCRLRALSSTRGQLATKASKSLL